MVLEDRRQYPFWSVCYQCNFQLASQNLFKDIFCLWKNIDMVHIFLEMFYGKPVRFFCWYIYNHLNIFFYGVAKIFSEFFFWNWLCPEMPNYAIICMMPCINRIHQYAIQIKQNGFNSLFSHDTFLFFPQLLVFLVLLRYFLLHFCNYQSRI